MMAKQFVFEGGRFLKVIRIISITAVPILGSFVLNFNDFFMLNLNMVMKIRISGIFRKFRKIEKKKTFLLHSTYAYRGLILVLPRGVDTTPYNFS